MYTASLSPFRVVEQAIHLFKTEAGRVVVFTVFGFALPLALGTYGLLNPTSTGYAREHLGDLANSVVSGAYTAGAHILVDVFYCTAGQSLFDVWQGRRVSTTTILRRSGGKVLRCLWWTLPMYFLVSFLCRLNPVFQVPFSFADSLILPAWQLGDERLSASLKAFWTMIRTHGLKIAAAYLPIAVSILGLYELNMFLGRHLTHDLMPPWHVMWTVPVYTVEAVVVAVWQLAWYMAAHDRTFAAPSARNLAAVFE